MNSKNIGIALIAVALFARYGGGIVPNTPDAPLAEPTAAMLKTVEPVVAVLRSSPLRAQYAPYFAACADAVRENRAIDSTTKLRKFNELVSASIARHVGKTAGLGDAANDAFIAVVGDDPVKLTDAKRAEAARFYEALAWVSEGRG